jgi:hypothetical protein
MAGPSPLSSGDTLMMERQPRRSRSTAANDPPIVVDILYPLRETGNCPQCENFRSPIRPTHQRGQRRDGGCLPSQRGFTLTLVPVRRHAPGHFGVRVNPRDLLVTVGAGDEYLIHCGVGHRRLGRHGGLRHLRPRGLGRAGGLREPGRPQWNTAWSRWRGSRGAPSSWR